MSGPPSVEGNRRRRRLRLTLLLLSIPIVFFALVVAVKLFSLAPLAQASITLYENGDYVASEQPSTALLENNLFEPWIPYFNRGAALAGQQDYIAAIRDFEQALPLTPDERKCEVVLNLSLSWERLADTYAQAGYFSGAVLLYQAAADVLAVEGEHCIPPTPPDGLNSLFDESVERLQDKMEAAEAARDAAGPRNGQGSGDPLEELGRRGDEAAQEKADNDSRTGEGGQPWSETDKPW